MSDNVAISVDSNAGKKDTDVVKEGERVEQPMQNHVEEQPLPLQESRETTESSQETPNEPPAPPATPEKTPKCGLFCWRPDFLQFAYNWKLALILICWYTFIRGLSSVGLNSVSSSSFERRFNVGSQQVGWFASASKFALGSSTIVFSYYGDRTSNKPRLIAFSAFLATVSSLLMALPHWIMEPYRSQSSLSVPSMCYLDDNYFSSVFPNTTKNVSAAACKDSSSSYFNLLIAANVLTGISTGIYVGVGIAFIDDFSTVASSGLNLGISYLSNAIGSGVGFGIGSAFMGMDVNFDKPGVPRQNPSDPSFLGAWWLGYAICIGLFATVTVGFLFFDDELPETARLRAEKLAKSQTHVSKIKVNLEESGRNKFARALAGLIDHLVRVITNPVVVSLTIATILHTLSIGGLQPFLIKMLQTLYGISEMMAGMTMGALIVVGIATGCFLSGLMVRRLEMSVRSMLLVTIFFTVLCLAFGFIAALTCPKEKLVGLTYDLKTSSYYSKSTKFNSSNLDYSCNANCGCQRQIFTPVCNTQLNIEFYSACYAGCQHFGKGANNQTDRYTFTDCSCLKNNKVNSTSVKYGLCTSGNCANMYIALVGIFLMLFCGFFILVPVTEVIMRTVPLEERSFSLAFFEALQCFLGAVPGPLLMGVVFDGTCILRQPNACKGGETGEVGACAVYDSFTLTWTLVGILSGFTFLAIICYAVAFIAYTPPSGETLGQYFRTLVKWWVGALCCRCCGKKNDAEERAKRHVTGEENGHDGPYTVNLKTVENSSARRPRNRVNIRGRHPSDSFSDEF